MSNSGGKDFSIDAIMDNKKPNYSYAALITQAIRSTAYQRATLQEIYEYIKTKYPFYQKNCKSWQNSVRHVLSTSKYFVNVERSPDDPGRGKYWVLSSDAQHLVIGQDTGRLRQPNQDIGISNMIPLSVCPQAYFLAGQPAFYQIPDSCTVSQQIPPCLCQNMSYIPMSNMQHMSGIPLDSYHRYMRQEVALQ